MLPAYIFFTLLYVVFGLLNFTMLKPLLDVLFSTNATRVVPAEPTFSWSLGYLLDWFNYSIAKRAAEDGQVAALQFVCFVFAGSILLSNIGRYFSTVMVDNLRTRTIRNLRNSVFEHVAKLHLGFFGNERKGEIMSHLTTDVQEVEGTVTNTMQTLIKEPLTLIGMIAVLIYSSWKLTLFAVLVLPVSGLLISTIVKNLKRDAGHSQAALSRILTVLDETFGGMRVILAFNAIPYITRKFQAENNQYAGYLMGMTRKRELAPAISEFFGALVVVIILLMGGSLVLGPEAEMSASAFANYLLLFSQVMRPTKELLTTFGNIQRGLASAERIFSVLDQKPAIVDKPNAITLNRLQQGVEFRNVSFSYGERQVLHDVSFTIPKGKTVALVGTSGGGKSTIADLLPRFYDVANGAILVDGHDIRDVSQDSLRGLMGIVTQESTLFNDSVYNNIAFGEQGDQMEKVRQAAIIAHADEFIQKLPNGYETEIGDRGGRLSGGQRQRLSIARAVFKNPEILILDEATSALDTESEKMVQDALSKLMKGRTALVIAHRLSTIIDADWILVVQDGRIVEQGTHTQLSEQPDGLYRKLSMLQSL